MDTMDLLRNAARSLPEAERGWLHCALEKIAQGEPPADALRLTHADRVRSRDAALLEAAEALGDTDNLWQKAQQLEKAIRRFESRVWPRIAHRTSPDLPPIDAALFRAFKTGARPIRSARKLWDLLK